MYQDAQKRRRLNLSNMFIIIIFQTHYTILKQYILFTLYLHQTNGKKALAAIH